MDDGSGAEEVNCSPLEGHTYAINHVEFSKDGSKLASSSLDGCTFIWNPLVSHLNQPPETECLLYFLQSGEKLLSVPKNSLSIKVCRFSFRSNWIVTGGDDEKAVIWDVESMQKVS